MGMESIFRIGVLLSLQDQFSNKMDSVVNKTQSSISKINSTFSGIQDAGKAMGGIGAGIAGVALSTVSATFDTKNALGELKSLGVKDLEAVEKAAKGFSDTFAGSTKADFISASYDIKSGISSLSDEGVAQFTDMAAKTAIATKSTTSEMTSLFATGYGIYKKQYKDLSDMEFGAIFSSGISTAVKNYKTAGSEMASAISALGATATNNNVSLQEQLAILGQLQTTMSGSEAATKYKAFLNAAAGAGKELGLSFVDANNQMLSMPEILEKLRGKYGDTIDAVEKQELKKAFGTDEAVAAIDLLYNNIGTLKTGIGDLESSMNKGMKATNQMADAINNTPERKLTVIKQQIHNNVEELGNGLLPVVNDTLSKVNKLISVASKWVSQNPELIRQYMEMALKIGGVLVVMGLFLTVVGTLGKGVLGLVSVIKTVKTAVAGLNLAFLSSPVTWVIIGIVALIAIFVVLWNKCEAFRNFWKGLFADFRSSASTAFKNIRPPLQELGQQFMELYQASEPILKALGVIIGTVLVVALAKVAGWIQGIANAVPYVIAAFSNLVSFAKNYINMIVALFHGDFSGAMDFAKAAIGNVVDYWKNIGQAALAFWRGFASGFTNVINKAFKAVGINAKQVVSNMKESVVSRLNGIKEGFQEKMTAAQNIVSSGISKIRNFFKFNWSLPKLKMPHFSISGKFSISPPSTPKFKVDWYAKGGILTKPTIFGMRGDTFLGGGEAGNEAVLPLSELWKNMRGVVGSVVQPVTNVVKNMWKKTGEKSETKYQSKEVKYRQMLSKSSLQSSNQKVENHYHISIKAEMRKLKDIEYLQELVDELKRLTEDDDPVTAPA